MQSLKRLTLSALALLLNVQAIEPLSTHAEDQPSSFSLEMDQHYIETHKYSHMIDRSISKRSSEQSVDFVTSLLQVLSGERQATLEIEAKIDAIFNSRKQKKKQSSWKSRLGQTNSMEIALEDAGFMWTAPVLMGASQTPLQLVFDLGSDWLTAQAKGCINCQGDVFDPSFGMKTSTVSETHSYGSANLTGYTYKDQVCLTSNSASCVQNFEYFAVFDQFGLRPPIEGILGLSQNKQFIFSDTPRENGPLFIQELQKAGKIKSQTFSFNQRGYYGDPSTFDIGDPVTAKMQNSSAKGAVTFKMQNDFFWSIGIQGVGFGESPQTNSFSFDEKVNYAIFDSGSSNVMMPPSVYESFILQLLEALGNPKYVQQSGMIIVDSQTIVNLVPVSFMFNNYWMTLDPEDYLLDVSRASDGSALLIMFLQNSYEFYIFGQPIMQNYYMTFSMENTTMTVIPNAWTTKKALQLGTVPETPLSSTAPKNPLYLQIVGILFLAAMVALYYYVIAPFLKNKFTNQTYIYGLQIIYMLGVGCLYYFVVVPLIGGPQNQLSLSQVAGIIGTVSGTLIKVFAFGMVAFVGKRYVSTARQTPTKTTEQDLLISQLVQALNSKDSQEAFKQTNLMC